MRAKAVWLALALSTLPSHAVPSEWVIRGRVVALSDGDTITILDSGKVQHKVRIAGIDAPERKQPYGTASRENLSMLVFDREVEARCYKRDRWGREICRIFEGLKDVGLAQVRAGMAWHFKRYEAEQTPEERRAYRDEEEAAKTANQGLWKESKPLPPWEWRSAR